MPPSNPRFPVVHQLTKEQWEKIPETSRPVVELLAKGYTHAKAAAALGITSAAVAGRAMRAWEILGVTIRFDGIPGPDTAPPPPPKRSGHVNHPSCECRTCERAREIDREPVCGRCTLRGHRAEDCDLSETFEFMRRRRLGASGVGA